MSVSPKTPALSVSGLNIQYGNHHAIKDLSVEIKTGELVGVIGPNGAGKTSFIKALCGRVKATGEIYVAGQLICSGNDRRSLIGLVPQDIGLYPQLTAGENLDVIARLLSIKKNNRIQAVTDALKAVDMTDKAGTLVEDMSGGMKRRINVAAAIMNNPPLVIFDEPTAGIDIPARDTVHRLARKLAEKGKAVILVTHELEQAEALCDKILLLKNGELLAYNTAPALLRNYFENTREVIVRFEQAPSLTTRTKMAPFEFCEAELPTIWKAKTDVSEVSFVSTFMAALTSQSEQVREISVRRPGLTSLMHHLQSGQGKLP